MLNRSSLSESTLFMSSEGQIVFRSDTAEHNGISKESRQDLGKRHAWFGELWKQVVHEEHFDQSTSVSVLSVKHDCPSIEIEKLYIVLSECFPPSGESHLQVSDNGKQLRVRHPLSVSIEQYFFSSSESLNCVLDGLAKPRKLTQPEIRGVLRPFHESLTAQTAFSESSRQAVRCMVENIQSELMHLKVPPIALPELRQNIHSQFQSSLVAKGEAVGIRAAEAFGQPLTQMALNAFHSSGALNTIGEDNIVKMRELFNNSLQMKNENCRIGFLNAQTMLDALNKKKEIVDTRLLKFLKVPPVLLTHESHESSISNLRDLLYSNFRSDGQVRSSAPVCGLRLRLVLDLDLMFQFRLSVHDIVKRIEDSCVAGSVVRFLFHPTHTGIVDIEPFAETVSTAERAKVFLFSVLVPEIINIRMCGIPGIENIIPEEIPIMSNIVDAVVDKTLWADLCPWVMQHAQMDYLAFVNLTKLAQYRLRLTDVEKLLRRLSRSSQLIKVECALGCLCHTERYVVYGLVGRSLQEVCTELQSASPGDVVLENQTVFDKHGFVHGSHAERMPPRLVHDLLLAYNCCPESNFVFVTTVGSNLEQLLARDDVDSSLTFSNNIRQVNELFGIEAAKSVLITEFWKLLERSGSKISARHVLLVADFMTNRGVVLGLTSSGLSLQPSATLTLMTFERPADHIFRMGMTGNEETINSVSSCVMTGQPPMVGTGASGVKLVVPGGDGSVAATSKQMLKQTVGGTLPFGRRMGKPSSKSSASGTENSHAKRVLPRAKSSQPGAFVAEVPEATFDEFDSPYEAGHAHAASKAASSSSMFDDFEESSTAAPALRLHHTAPDSENDEDANKTMFPQDDDDAQVDAMHPDVAADNDMGDDGAPIDNEETAEDANAAAGDEEDEVESGDEEIPEDGEDFEGDDGEDIACDDDFGGGADGENDSSWTDM